MTVRWRALLAVLLVSLLAAATPVRVPAVARAPAPAWVEWLPLPAPSARRRPEVENGQYTLLSDVQVRFDGRHATTFKRQASLVTDRSGLEEAAQQKLDFTPATEDLVIHRIALWRGGRVIDVTGTAAVDLLRRETDLDKGIITDGRTALIRIADVRVGDVVDLAWSWRDHDPAWAGIYAADFSLGWSVPVALTRVRLATPAAMPIEIRARNGVPAPRVVQRGGETVREWRVADPEPVRDAERSPDWWRPWAQVSVSTMAQWAAVVRWAQPFYAGKLALPPGWAAAVDRIAAQTSDPATRTVAALRMVQDQVRYTSLSIGDRGYVPRPPAETIANGFGDCKDKAQLLVATLARLGITAWPALTDSDEGPALASILPNPGAFDHVVVLARVGGRDYWLDPTGSHEGGRLGTLAALPYAWALPIRAGQSRLLAIPNPVPSAPTMATLDRYRRTPAGVAFDTTTRFTYDEADIKRAALAESGSAKLARDDLAFYRTLYPGLVLRSPIQIRDDRDLNRLIVHERYLLPADSPGHARTLSAFEVQGWTLRDLFKTVARDRGEAPIVLPFTVNRSHRVVIDTPGHRPALPRDVRSDGPAFTLAMTGRRDRDRLTLDWTLIGKAMTIPGAAAADYADQVKALDDATWWSFDLDTAEGAAGAASAPPDWLILVLVFGWAALASLALMKLLREPHRAASPFVAMPLWRFALLAIATFGVYPAYWSWRHWRWLRRAGGEAISPFWRALFAPLMAGPLFFSANARAVKPLPARLGYTMAAALVIGGVGVQALRLLHVPGAAIAGMPLALCYLPAVAAVNRANFRARVVRGGRLEPLAIAALVLGSATWALTIAALADR